MSSSSSSSDSLCAGFVRELPIQHAAVSTLGDPFEVETICASDDVAAMLDGLQLDLGVGPCWQARATRTPVLFPDVRRHAGTAWPMLLDAADATGIRSVYAFPLHVGLLDVGAVSLYGTSRGALSQADIDGAARMTRTVAVAILDDALAAVDVESDVNTSPRRFVHQAAGMVAVQLRRTPADALVIIRAHAFATGRSVSQVIEAVLARELDFSA